MIKTAAHIAIVAAFIIGSFLKKIIIISIATRARTSKLNSMLNLLMAGVVS